VLFCTFGIVQSYGVYQDYYTRISLTEHTPSEISWIGSIQVFFVFAMGLPAGRLFDAGYFHHCLISGSLIYLFSAMMLSLVKPHHYYQNFLAQGVGMGIGMGLMMLPTLSVASHYFRVKRSLAMGIMVSGSSLGGCLYPILLNNVFQRASGFPWAVRAVGFIDLGFLLTANLVMRTRLPPRKNQINNLTLFKEVLRDIPYMVYIAGSFLAFWGAFVPFFYLQLYASLHNINPVFTRYSITIMNGASMFGRTIPNFAADYYGSLNVLITSTLVTGALVFAMFGATSIGGVATFGVFYGFFSGGVISLVTPAASTFSKRPDLSDVGIRLGVLSFLLSFALLTGNPIAGALLSPPHYKWHRPLVFAAVILFSGGALLTLSRRSLARRRGSKFV